MQRKNQTLWAQSAANQTHNNNILLGVVPKKDECCSAINNDELDSLKENDELLKKSPTLTSLPSIKKTAILQHYRCRFLSPSPRLCASKTPHLIIIIVLVSVGMLLNILSPSLTLLFLYPDVSSSIESLYDVDYATKILKYETHLHPCANSTSSSSSSSSSSLLVAQYGYDYDNTPSVNNSYAKMLDITSRINKAYAKRYCHDYILAKGTYFKNWHSPSTTPPSRATFNKIAILRYAMSRGYSLVLLLDSDALVYDFSRDVATTYDMTNAFFLGHRVYDHHVNATWNVNIGVGLWNVTHVMARSILDKWDKMARFRTYRTGLRDSDQRPLQKVFWSIPERRRPVNAILEDFAYGNGTVVRHFTRPVSSTWDDRKFDSNERMTLIENTVREICETYSLDDCHVR